MFGKPSRYYYTDPMKVMDQDGVPLTVKDKDDKSLTGFTFPEELRGDSLPPKIKSPHSYYPTNPVKMHNNTIPYIDPVEYARIENKRMMRGELEFYDPLHSSLANFWLRKNEPKVAWGLPYTNYFRLILTYFVGVEVARRQGYLGLQFWKFHYFDWLRFAKAAFVFGYLGGGLLGMFFWGDYRLAWARTKSWFITKQHTSPYTTHDQVRYYIYV